ncbi:MAG: hypothetical protein HXS48_03425 [Theionarchaea archaeon]|nr:hypothetical protein [Theionarchaea archaeon]
MERELTNILGASEKDEAVEDVWAVADKFYELSEDERNERLLRLAEKDEAAESVARTIAENFHKLPENVRKLLFTLAEKDEAAGAVAWAVADNFHKLPENVRKLLFTLAEKDEAVRDVAWAVADNFHKLPEKVRKLLFKLAEKDEAAGAVAWAVADNFDEIPRKMRNELLLKLAEKDEAAEDVARSVADNFHKLSEEVRNEFLLKLAEKDEAAEDVARSVADNFDEIPRRMRNELLLKLAEKDEAAEDVARSVADNLYKLPEKVRKLLFKLAEKDEAAGAVAWAVADNFDKFPKRMRNELLLKLAEKDEAAEGVARAVADNFDELSIKVRDELLLKLKKIPEELYDENVRVTEELQTTISQLKGEKMKRFLAERDAAWKDVAFKAAHKLGNPIDAIETFLKSLEIRIKAGNIEEAVNICEKMEKSIEETKVVIAQFKSLTKSQEINYERINIKEIIEQAFKVISREDVGVEIVAPGKIPEVVGDRDRMIEVFNELVANSLNWFDKDEKRIYAKIERVHRREIPPNLDPSNRYLRIIFADNGQGIPSSDKDRIFAPFWTTYPHGTGLGLAMVKWIIEAHDGRISEEGKRGKGAKFIIFLRIAKGGRKNA